MIELASELYGERKGLFGGREGLFGGREGLYCRNLRFSLLAILSRFFPSESGILGRVRTSDLHPSRHQKGVTVQRLDYASCRRQCEFTF